MDAYIFIKLLLINHAKVIGIDGWMDGWMYKYKDG